MKSLLLNGKRRETSAETVSELVKELSLDPARIALERNGDIVRKSLYSQTSVLDGDKIEIVHFVGGG
jgi:thiazole synthase